MQVCVLVLWVTTKNIFHRSQICNETLISTYFLSPQYIFTWRRCCIISCNQKFYLKFCYSKEIKIYHIYMFLIALTLKIEHSWKTTEYIKKSSLRELSVSTYPFKHFFKCMLNLEECVIMLRASTAWAIYFYNRFNSQQFYISG